MAFVRSAGKGFFPLDEELELLPGMLTPHGHECLVQLSGWMPFAKAAEILEDFMGDADQQECEPEIHGGSRGSI